MRGGVIGGGVAIIFYLLLYSCFFFANIGLEPGEVGFTYSCLVFAVISPIYPVAWLLSFLEPVFNYHWTFAGAYAPILSIPIWFVISTLIGAIVDHIKSKKKNTQ